MIFKGRQDRAMDTMRHRNQRYLDKMAGKTDETALPDGADGSDEAQCAGSEAGEAADAARKDPAGKAAVTAGAGTMPDAAPQSRIGETIGPAELAAVEEGRPAGEKHAESGEKAAQEAVSAVPDIKKPAEAEKAEDGAVPDGGEEIPPPNPPDDNPLAKENLEKGDIPAIIISALLTFMPVLLILAAVMLLLVKLLR